MVDALLALAAVQGAFLAGLLLGKLHERRQWQSRSTRLDQLRRILRKDDDE